MQIEDLKVKLYNCMDKYGHTDQRTVDVSQELDRLIVLEQRRINNVD